MTKQEVLDAINATMVPNGIKAINADSIRNLLTMMMDFVGEGGSGSGDGALRVIVPELLVFGLLLGTVGAEEFSPTSWAEVKPVIEQLTPGVDLTEYEAAVNAAFEHNANVAQQIIAKAKEGKGVLVMIDQTPLLGPAITALLQAQGMTDMAEEMVGSASQPAGLTLQYIKTTAEGEAAGMTSEFVCIISPAGETGDIDYPNYFSDMLLYLQRDGTLVFKSKTSEEEGESGTESAS